MPDYDDDVQGRDPNAPAPAPKPMKQEGDVAEKPEPQPNEAREISKKFKDEQREKLKADEEASATPKPDAKPK